MNMQVLQEVSDKIFLSENAPNRTTFVSQQPVRLSKNAAGRNTDNNVSIEVKNPNWIQDLKAASKHVFNVQRDARLQKEALEFNIDQL